MKLFYLKKNYFFSFLLITFILSGCTSDDSKPTASAYRDYFTDEETKSGTATFDLMEHVHVNAEITPYDKYSNGLKKYYMEQYHDINKNESKADFMKQPRLYGKSISKIQKLFALFFR